MAQQGLLSGVTVVDLSRILAGPYCTMLLADLGARVIKVERPGGGDDARRIGPFRGDRSAYFMSLNRGKQSIALDLKATADREVFEQLLERADVLVENFRPGTLARLGYDWDTLHSRTPRLIYAALSGFGTTGPYASRPAYDLIVQAMGGVMSLTGHPGNPPTRVGTSVGDIAAGLFTAVGVCAALRQREHTGAGAMLDVAMLDCQVALLENAIARAAISGEAPGPCGSRHPSITPFQAYRAADGHLVVAAGNDGLFAKLAGALERPDWISDPRFADNGARCDHVAELEAEIEGVLAAAPVSHWLARLEQVGVPCGPIQDVAQVLADPQVAARRMLVEAADPVAGSLRMAGNPIKCSTAADPLERPPAPALDADRAAILAELGRE